MSALYMKKGEETKEEKVIEIDYSLVSPHFIRIPFSQILYKSSSTRTRAFPSLRPQSLIALFLVGLESLFQAHGHIQLLSNERIVRP
jgi:hypothetical protein